jgi:hypothetical protein
VAVEGFGVGATSASGSGSRMPSLPVVTDWSTSYHAGSSWYAKKDSFS